MVELGMLGDWVKKRLLSLGSRVEEILPSRSQEENTAVWGDCSRESPTPSSQGREAEAWGRGTWQPATLRTQTMC